MLRCIGCLEEFGSPHLLLPLSCPLSYSMAKNPTYLLCDHSAVLRTYTCKKTSALLLRPMPFNVCLSAIHQITRDGDSGVRSCARKSSRIVLCFANLFSLSISLDCLESMYLLTHRLLPLLLPFPTFQLVFPHCRCRWPPRPWHLSRCLPTID